MNTDTLMKAIMTVVVVFSIVTMVIAYDFTKNVKESHAYREKLNSVKNMCNGAIPLDESMPPAFCKCLSEGKSDMVCKVFLMS